MKTLFNFVALDIETTGFDFQTDEIIEIGAVRFEQGKKTAAFSTFIKPTKPVSAFIKQLTHITDEQLAKGEQLKNALNNLRAYLQNDIIVCHNKSFDLGFINKKLELNGLPGLKNEDIDTLDLSRLYLPFTLNHKLETVCEYFQVELENAHRAIYDAEATGLVLLNLLAFIDENIPLQLNFKLLEIGRYAESPVTGFLEKIVEHQKKHALLTKKKSAFKFHNRNYISHQPSQPRDYEMAEIFGPEGIFAGKFPGYELRPGQMQMALAVEEVFRDLEYLLVEAGTGVGKSLAYLLPAIRYSIAEACKVVISTNTKNLQEQLFYKDLPAVRDHLDLPFSVTLLKGRRNYLCSRKWQEVLMDINGSFSPEEAAVFMNLFIWRNFTRTGDISENSSFQAGKDGQVWKKVMADRHFCNGKHCQFYSNCFLMDIRRKAEKSNLVIINHHLLLADMNSDNSALGDYENLIIDEAHNLPHMAPAELGISLSFADINNFFQQLFAVRNRFQSGILPSLKSDAKKSQFEKQDFVVKRIDNAIKLMKDNREMVSDLFKKIGSLVDKSGNYGKLRITDLERFPFITDFISRIIIFWEELSTHIMSLKDSLSLVKSDVFVNYEKNLENLEGSLQRLSEFHNTFVSLYNPELKDYAFWLESISTNDENYPKGVFNYAPLNINQLLYDKLYKNVRSIIFTSATIAIRGVFKYFSNRMGLDMLEPGFVRELVVASPFDYQKQTRIMVSAFLPEPKDRFFSTQSIELIRNAIEVSKTGTMILFTSYKDLNNVYDLLSEEFYARGIPLFAQNKGISRSAMLREFRQKGRGVLLGTSSFWEGVDIPGEALQLLILYKLPFMVPSEPIVEAFLEKLQMEGKDSFMHYMLPNSILKYRQGFGRLIRNKTDKGVVLVLDNRISTKKYGKYFVEAVPAQTILTSNEIEIYDYLGRWFGS
jgi:predicted DnaQ family exonuclease/DinG family helicase